MQRLRALSTPDGRIAALAIDQRRSLRVMLAAASGKAESEISDEQLGQFKAAVTRKLSPYASAVLIDPEFGTPAFAERASDCGLLMTYEMDGFENPRPHKMLALMPTLSVRRLRDAGAQGVKILLTYSPEDDKAANEQKHALIERIGAECAGLEMPFLLEPVGYDPGGLDLKSVEYARKKPDIVLAMMREFSKERYAVDVLKVEFPVNAAYVDGSAVFGGTAAYSMGEALDSYRRVDDVAGRPYIYLSAGVSARQFIESLRLAAEARARFSGVLCGRAYWQDGAPAWARGGLPELERWLDTEGVANMRAVSECLTAAVPWSSRVA